VTGALAFALLAANPIGGLAVAIPFGVLTLDYPPWLTVAFGVPLAYLQVFVVDLGWSTLARWPWWQRVLAKSRGRWAKRLVDSRGAFWVTFAATPVLGPWLVMALMRWVGVPQRRVALALVTSLVAAATVMATACRVLQ
jgi:hypothetical protein